MTTQISVQTLRRAVAALDVRIARCEYDYAEQIDCDRVARGELATHLYSRGGMPGPWHGHKCACEPGTHASRCPTGTADYPEDRALSARQGGR